MQYANSETPTVTVGGQEPIRFSWSTPTTAPPPTRPLTAATQLVSEGVSLWCWAPYGSGVSIAAGPTFGNAGLPAIGVTCTNPKVTAGNDYYFRICFLDPSRAPSWPTSPMEIPGQDRLSAGRGGQ